MKYSLVLIATALGVAMATPVATNKTMRRMEPVEDLIWLPDFEVTDFGATTFMDDGSLNQGTKYGLHVEIPGWAEPTECIGRTERVVSQWGATHGVPMARPHLEASDWFLCSPNTKNTRAPRFRFTRDPNGAGIQLKFYRHLGDGIGPKEYEGRYRIPALDIKRDTAHGLGEERYSGPTRLKVPFNLQCHSLKGDGGCPSSYHWAENEY